jgi:hypothetical protein
MNAERATMGLTATTSRILSQNSHLDLTNRIEFVDQVVRGHGGYSDVYYGRFVEDDRYVAIKQLRVHIQKEQQLSNVSASLLDGQAYTRTLL